MKHPVDVAAGARIRDLRMARGLSQTNIAEACGISFQQVQKYESGTNRVSLSRLIEICKTLRVRPGEIVDSLMEVN